MLDSHRLQSALLAIVVTSYRQTIFAYPHGGGSYTVARENLGIYAGLVARSGTPVHSGGGAGS